MIRVGIIGGAGYTAGELIRILLHHPAAEIAFVQSRSSAGKPVPSVHDDLVGDTDLRFVAEVPAEPDVLFLCSGHGESKAFLEKNSFSNSLKIIDLSHDFRLQRPGNDFVYGLSELNRAAICEAQKIANPGCFATAIQLALLPLAAEGLLNDEVHVHAITGSTGAGQQPTDTTHFSWRSNNLSIYKPFGHQHLGEIGQSLLQLQPSFDKSVNFLPVRGDFTRGIFASAYTHCEATESQVKELYRTYYHDAPFTKITNENPSLKQVVNTNKCLLHLEKHGNKLLIISIIDNLLKGASGQAVQNMNLLLGLEESTGLNLKSIAF
jgi:N-acetyl-gamma-glutamyl-phosphate reductase